VNELSTLAGFVGTTDLEVGGSKLPSDNIDFHSFNGVIIRIGKVLV
jgi:hypothetical protein